MFCKKCGNQLNDNAEVCPACGTPVTTTQTGAQWAQPVTQQPVAQPAAEPVKGKKAKKAKKAKDPNKKGGKKKIIIPVIALVLVAAIVAGALLIFQNPAVKVLNAAKKTIFESSELKITIIDHDNWSKEYYDIDENTDSVLELEILFGEDIESSEGNIKLTSKYVDRQYDSYYDDYYGYYEYDYDNYEDYVRESKRTYSYKDGKFYADGEKYDDTLNDLAKLLEDELEEEFGIKVNLIDVANMIIKGKIDEDGLTEVFNTILVPNIEKIVNEELETDLDLPEFEGLMTNVEDFVKRAYKEEVVELEKADSKNKGTTYDYSIDVGKTISCFLDYAQEEESLNKYLQYAVDEVKARGYDYFDDVNDLVEMLKDEFDADIEIEGEVTVSGGRITNFTICNDGETIYTITIESKK